MDRWRSGGEGSGNGWLSERRGRPGGSGGGLAFHGVPQRGARQGTSNRERMEGKAVVSDGKDTTFVIGAILNSMSVLIWLIKLLSTITYSLFMIFWLNSTPTHILASNSGKVEVLICMAIVRSNDDR